MTTNTVFRVEVRPKAGHADPIGEAARQRAMSLDLPCEPTKIDSAAIYLLQGNITQEQLEKLADQLLADVVIDSATFGSAELIGESLIEIHPLPGVMDPDAEVIELAIHSILGIDVQVRTGKRYDMHGIDSQTAQLVAQSCLANPVVHAIHNKPYHPQAFPKTSPYELRVVSVPLLEMDDKALTSFSREAHLFLSLEEMQEIQAHYKKLGRDPRDIELETLAQTWSEHCVHKTLKATIRYCEDDSSAPIDMSNRPGHVVNDDGSVTINNLLKSTIAAATKELMADGIDWCLSVFVDNAGIIAFDDRTAVCFKVETHNHPSAIEPYGGAATGIGGCIRDIIGTGLAAKPIAATDIFCVGFPDHFTAENLPTGCLHPKRILTEIVSGVRDYGNRMGIPTIDGAVWFDNDYVGNPLVYCGCVGVMPRDKVTGDPNPGDRIIALGGRTGRDGIHGATFSSSELTDVHADEFSHAVQIGNPVTEKKMLDAILQARDHQDGCLFTSITDCGAGGFSSAVGEMGEKLGAKVNLEQAPLKYDGLNPTEIWISEAQERMVLAVEPDNVEKLKAICDLHVVQMCDLGEFGTDDRELILLYEGTEVGRLSMEFLHDGLPKTTRQATWSFSVSPTSVSKTKPSITEALLKLLAHPNIASKHWIIRQYDHEVQGGSAVTPLVGVNSEGPSDASVILPVLDSLQGLAIGNGLATGLKDDPYHMAIAAVDECVRNLVCVGADPKRIAILDNFCWPSCDNAAELGGLVRAAEGCYDAAKAYRTPFISGKDSLNNQFATDDGRTIKIPPTLLISGMGIVPDINKCVTMDAKKAGNCLVLVNVSEPSLRGSHYELLFGRSTTVREKMKHLKHKMTRGAKLAQLVFEAIQLGLIESAHDVSDGGLLVAAAEMCIAGDLGLDLYGLDNEIWDFGMHPIPTVFGEAPGMYLLEVRRELVEVQIEKHFRRYMFECGVGPEIGRFNDSGRLIFGNSVDVSVNDLRAAWRDTLDW